MDQSTTCPICLSALQRKETSSDDFQYSCPACGTFRLTGSARVTIANTLTDIPDPKRAILSHQVRRMQANNDRPTLDSEDVKTLLKLELPRPAEQAENLLRWLGSNVEADESITRPTAEVMAIVGTPRRLNALRYVISHLESEQLIHYEFHGSGQYPDSIELKMQFPGWHAYEELRIQSAESRLAFMAMKFGDPELDSVVDDILRLAVDATGFTLQVLTDRPRAGLIDDRLRVEIRRSRFLIADLTHGNAGAYWEAGFAEGLGKPVIYTCKKAVFDDKDKKPHFDTNHHLTVLWDPKDLEAAARDLKATIRATLPSEARLND